MLSDIKYFFKIFFPSLSILFLIFLNLFISKNFFDFGQLFVFQAIFFWLLYLPKLIPLYIILIVGVLQDIIYISPIGSTALVFLFLIFLFEKYNKFFLEPSFFELFISFIALFTIGLVALWALNSLINLKLLLININFFYEILLNTFFFPINYFFLDLCFKKLNLNKKL
jgi:rod shape-determining protein MreD